MRKYALYIFLNLLLFMMIAISGCQSSLNDGEQDNQTPELTFSIDNLAIPASGGNYTLPVTANYPDWQIEVTEGNQWCHATQTKEGLALQIDKNTSRSSRIANIRITIGKNNYTTSRSITVNQAGGIPTPITLNPDIVVFETSGGVQNVSVNDNGHSWNAEVISGSPWCTISISDNQIRVSSTKNSNEEAREAMIIITPAEEYSEENSPEQVYLKVQQKGTTPMLEVSDYSLPFTIQGGTATLTVTTNQSDWTVQMDSKDWFSYRKEKNKLIVTANENKDIQSRKATMTIQTGNLSREVTIVQNGIEGMLEVYPQNISFKSTGHIQNVSVVTNIGNVTAISANPEWCTVSATTQFISVTTTANKEKNSRHTTITVKAGEEKNTLTITLNVTQEGTTHEEQSVSLMGTWLSADSDEESCFTFYENNTFYIIQSAGLTGEGTYTVKEKQIDFSVRNISLMSATIVSLDSNTLVLDLPEARTTFKREKSSSLSLSKSQIELERENSNATIIVTSNTLWGITGIPDWLSAKPNTGKGNSNITLTALENQTGEIRKADLTIYAGNQKQTLKVTQKTDGAATLNLNPNSLNTSATQTEQQIQITSNQTWTVEDIPSWISVKPMFGEGNETITLTIKVNQDTKTREAILRIVGDKKEATLTVNQEAMTENFEIDNTSFEVPATGSEETLHITTNQSWQISHSYDWITVSPANGKNDATVKIKTTPNNGSSSRTGRLTITAGTKSKTIIVSQVAVQEYTIPIRFTGEATGCGQSESGKHLFAIQVMKRTRNSNDTYKPYGYGLFDDSASIKVKLPDTYEYKIMATLVLHGKERIEHSNNYNAPFQGISGTGTPQGTSVTNTLTATTDRSFNGLNSGTTVLSDGKTYSHPDLTRYYGESSSFTPDGDSPREIILKSVAFGLAVQVTDITTGNIRVELDGAPTFRFGKTEGYKGEKTFSFSNTSGGWTGDSYSETCGVRVVLEETDGTARTLYYEKVKFTRNQSSKLTAKYTKGGYSFIWETQPMEDKNLGDFNANVWW